MTRRCLCTPASCSRSIARKGLEGTDQGGVRLPARERTASWVVGTEAPRAPSTAMVLLRATGLTLPASILLIVIPSGVSPSVLAAFTIAPAANSTFTTAVCGLGRLV